MSLVSILKETWKNLVKNPLRTFLTASILTGASFLAGCEEEPTPPEPTPPPSTGVVLNIDSMMFSQRGGFAGWTWPYPDCGYAEEAYDGYPNFQHVNFFGFEGFAQFWNNYYGYIRGIRNITCQITSTTPKENSVIGIGNFTADYYWHPQNCANANNYYGGTYLTQNGNSVLFWMNGFCGKWPINGIFFSVDPDFYLRYVNVGPYPWFGDVPDEFKVDGELAITCLSSKKKMIAKAPYTMMRKLGQIWFAQEYGSMWGNQCAQQMPTVASAVMLMGEPETFYKNTEPDLNALKAARISDATLPYNSNTPAWKSSSNSLLFLLTNSKPVLKCDSRNKKANNLELKATYETNNQMIKNTTLGGFVQSANGEIIPESEMIDYNISNVVEPNAPIAAYAIETPEDVWNAVPIYWYQENIYLPQEAADVNLLAPRYSNGSTLMCHVTDANGIIKSYYEIPCYPVAQGEDAVGPYINVWSCDVIPSWTPSSEGLYPSPDPNAPYLARIVVPIEEGARISGPYTIPDNAPTGFRQLKRFCDNYLNPNSYDASCDTRKPYFLVNLRDFADFAKRWNPKNN